jgi:hypothetical protein
VDAGEEDVVAAAEGLGGAVAVVDVPVEDEDALGAQLGDRQLGGDRDVVEEAEAHRPVRLGVVAGRPAGAEGDRGVAGEEPADHLAGAPGRVKGGAVGGLAGVGVGVDRAAAGGAEPADPLDVPALVDAQQVPLLGDGGEEALPAEPVALGERRLDRPQPQRRLGVPRQPGAGVVLQAGRVAEVEHAGECKRRAPVFRAGDQVEPAAMARQLNVGETLGEVFAIYREHAGVLLPIAFWLFLLVAVAQGLAESSVGLLGLAFVFATIVATLYQGVVVTLVRDAKAGRRDFSMGELVGAAMPLVGPLFGAGLLAALGIAVGLFLLVVPGLFLLTIWAVIAPAIVIERAGVIEAFRRSRQLVEGSNWQVFGVLAVSYLIALLGSLILNSVAATIADGPIVRIVFSAIASTFTAPIAALAASVLYFRLVEINRPASVTQ